MSAVRTAGCRNRGLDFSPLPFRSRRTPIEIANSLLFVFLAASVRVPRVSSAPMGLRCDMLRQRNRGENRTCSSILNNAFQASSRVQNYRFIERLRDFKIRGISLLCWLSFYCLRIESISRRLHEARRFSSFKPAEFRWVLTLGYIIFRRII